MAPSSIAVILAALYSQCIFGIASAQTTSGLKPLSYKGCFSSSTPLDDQGSWTYQSPGYCQQQCVDANKPVMGTTEGSNCWCGDLIPAASSKVSDSECSTNCQGYPADKCGGSGTWSVSLTGLDNAVGNAPDSGSSSSSNSDLNSNSGSMRNSGSDSDSDSDSKPKAAASSLPSTMSTSTPTAKSKPSSLPQVQQAPDSSKDDPPSTITRASTVVVTAPGETKAVPAPAQTQEKPKGSNTAGIAAGVVVGIVAIAAIAGGLFFFLRNRKRRAAAEAYNQNPANPFVTENRPPPSSSSMSDSRLEPSVMMQRRQSDGSIADNQDYSRRILKVTNPSGD